MYGNEQEGNPTTYRVKGTVMKGYEGVRGGRKGDAEKEREIREEKREEEEKGKNKGKETE